MVYNIIRISDPPLTQFYWKFVSSYVYFTYLCLFFFCVVLWNIIQLYITIYRSRSTIINGLQIPCSGTHLLYQNDMCYIVSGTEMPHICQIGCLAYIISLSKWHSFCNPVPFLVFNYSLNIKAYGNLNKKKIAISDYQSKGWSDLYLFSNFILHFPFCRNYLQKCNCSTRKPM